MGKSTNASFQTQLSPVEQSAKPVSSWACQSTQDGVAIDAYIDAMGEWATVARVKSVDGVDAQAIAEQIVQSANGYEKQQALMAEMVMTMKMFLECKGISWEAEHDAEILIHRYETMNK